MTVHSFYHVTTLTNYHKIMQTGLKPQIGPRSQKLNEATNAIYLFNSLNDCTDGVLQWLGEEFAESETLVYLKIAIDLDDPALNYQPDLYESAYSKTIKPSQIKLRKSEAPV